ncbi:cytochrome b5-like heme/steroid binding domain-containing protein, partial [Chamaesiphon sp. GL140_3_metabinner_50]|uniref:cytochrome b5-like heme/steroid binding domain-containing protein n=1 Tax=Chamaesiphon sp. GL140_3_metabinner_50 TaxID=2970812 RepID=UPI0025D1B4FD
MAPEHQTELLNPIDKQLLTERELPPHPPAGRPPSERELPPHPPAGRPPADRQLPPHPPATQPLNEPAFPRPEADRKPLDEHEAPPHPPDGQPLANVWIYEGVAYDLTEFIGKHPGGQFFIGRTKNRDITTIVNIFHSNPEKVKRIIQKYALDREARP